MCHFHFILLIREKSLSSPTLKGRGIGLYLFRMECQRIHIRILKPLPPKQTSPRRSCDFSYRDQKQTGQGPLASGEPLSAWRLWLNGDKTFTHLKTLGSSLPILSKHRLWDTAELARGVETPPTRSYQPLLDVLSWAGREMLLYEHPNP